MEKVRIDATVDVDVKHFYLKVGGSTWLNSLIRREMGVSKDKEYNNKTCEKCKAIYTTKECPQCKMIGQKSLPDKIREHVEKLRKIVEDNPESQLAKRQLAKSEKELEEMIRVDI